MDEDLHGSPALRGIVDRLTFNGAIMPTGTESYHLAHTKAQAEHAVPAEHINSRKLPQA